MSPDRTGSSGLERPPDLSIYCKHSRDISQPTPVNIGILNQGWLKEGTDGKKDGCKQLGRNDRGNDAEDTSQWNR